MFSFSPKNFLILKLLVVSTCIFLFSAAQAQTANEYVKMGERSVAEKDFYGASLYFKSALIEDSTDLYLLSSYCNALKGYNNYELAVIFYEKLVKADKNLEYPEAVFWYGTMLKSHGEYERAKVAFSRFVSIYTDRQAFLFKKAQQEIKSCEFARRFQKEIQPFKVVNAGSHLNTENADFAAVPLTDSVILYSSLRAGKVVEVLKDKNIEYQVKLFQAEGADSSWKALPGPDSLINKAGHHIANGTYSADGKQFVFSSCDENYFCRIYKTDLLEGKWAKPEALDQDINQEGFTATQPYLTEIDGKEVLFFVSDRPGSIGKLDIWYSVKNDSDSFSTPVNAGPAINSIDDEVTPFYDADSSILYFSSGWHFGLGGFDIFRSKGGLKHLGKPENLGVPFNSPANDFYYIHSEPERKKGFLSSNRVGSITKKGETCCNDIWVFSKKEIPEKKNSEGDSLQLVKDFSRRLEEVNKLLPLSLYFHNDEPCPRSRDTAVSLSYDETYFRFLNLKNNYKIGYSGKLAGQAKNEAEAEIEKYFNSKVERNFKVLGAFADSLLELLQKGISLKLEVRGFASPLAANDYNILLSKRRISTFRNYLKNFRGGAFLPFLNDSHSTLVVVELPFGEEKADTMVSDFLEKPEKSVYSPAAAAERRIEIVSITALKKDLKFSALEFESQKFDFGRVKEREKVQGSFKFTNHGNVSLKILQVSASCGCTATSASKYILEPGETGEISFEFDTTNKIGFQEKTVTVETDAAESIFLLKLTGEVYR